MPLFDARIAPIPFKSHQSQCIKNHRPNTTKKQVDKAMAAPAPTSALDMDNPETDTREAFQRLTEAEKEQHGGWCSIGMEDIGWTVG